MLLSLVPLADTEAATARPLFEQVGSLPRFPADARALVGSDLVPTFDKATVPTRNKSGTVIALPKVRQLWQIYANDAATKSAVVVRDLDSLKIVRTLTFNTTAFDRATTSPTDGGGWTHVVDDSGTRLFLLSTGGTHIYDFDLRTFAFKVWPLPASSLNFAFTFLVAGMTYDPFDRKLLLLFAGPPSGSVLNVNTFLYRLDVGGTPPASFAAGDLTKMYRLRSCTAPVSSVDLGGETTNWEVLVTQPYLYVPCQRAGHTVVVVRVARPDGNDPDHPEDVVAGPVYGETVMADQVSRRLFVTTTRREIWAFEGETMSFVGVIATGPQNTEAHTGYGVDHATGRVFFQSPTFGLGVVEGRFFPLPQARTMDRRVTGHEQIWSDAATNRVFVLEGDGFVSSKAAEYKIYTTAEAPLPPPKPDPDRNTADIAEKEGVTEPRWNASGSGYGTRVLLAKGVATIAPAPTLGVNAPTADALLVANRKCSFTDRDLFVGRVAKAEYDTGSTAAQAIAADVDNATRQDLNQTSRCDLPAPLDRPSWTASPAACSTGAGDPIQTPASGEPRVGTATVTCPEPGGVLEAQAQASTTGLVNVDRSWTKTTVLRLPGGGVRTTAEAVAQGVSLDIAGVGVIAIGEVRSVASSVSNGRPQRKGMSTHEIEISHVRVGAQTICELRCDLITLEQDLNTLAGSRAVFRTGKGPNSGRDEGLVEGSPRGAQTAVQKSVARQASDRALVGDFTVEVPAFEMTVFNDNTRWGRARQLYQFAGVATSATYNIVVRPSFVPFDDAGGDLPVENVAGGDAGNTPFAGLIEAVDDGNRAVDVPTLSAVAERDEDGDSGVQAVLNAVARGLRLFFSNPRHALLLLTAWALLAAPAVLSRRRRLLGAIRG